MSKTYVAAVRLLARREHGAHELYQKLTQKGHPEIDIQEALAECQRLGLQSDARFVDTICRARIRQGYGPLKIRLELQNKQLDRDLINQALDQDAEHWLMHAKDVRLKKYKEQDDCSFEAIQKQKQFLLYRGFSTDTINMVFRD